MKKQISIIFIISLFFLIIEVFLVLQKQRDLQDYSKNIIKNHQIRILCLGDSLSLIYPFYLKNELHSWMPFKNPLVISYINYQHNPQEFEDALKKMIATYKPHFIITMFGLYDYESREKIFPRKTFFENYKFESIELLKETIGSVIYPSLNSQILNFEKNKRKLVEQAHLSLQFTNKLVNLHKLLFMSPGDLMLTLQSLDLYFSQFQYELEYLEWLKSVDLALNSRPSNFIWINENSLYYFNIFIRTRLMLYELEGSNNNNELLMKFKKNLDKDFAVALLLSTKYLTTIDKFNSSDKYHLMASIFRDLARKFINHPHLYTMDAQIGLAGTMASFIQNFRDLHPQAASIEEDFSDINFDKFISNLTNKNKEALPLVRATHSRMATLSRQNQSIFIAIEYPFYGEFALKKLLENKPLTKVLNLTPIFNKEIKNFSYSTVFNDRLTDRIGHFSDKGNKTLANLLAIEIMKSYNNF